MADRYEYYITGDDSARTIYNNIWMAQTFTPVIAHKITSVKLKLGRATYPPGTVTVSIRATDGSGHPTGGDLCVGTTDGSTLPTSSPWEWREITLGDGYSLDVDTKYAIVLRNSALVANRAILWLSDISSPTYPRGNVEDSGDSGGSWSAKGIDAMFEEWGEPPYTLHEKTLIDGIDIGEVLIKNPVKVLSDGIALTDTLVKALYKVISDGIALTDIVIGYRLLAKVLIDGIAVGESLTKTTVKVLVDGIKFTDVYFRFLEKILVDGIAVGETLTKTTVKVLVDGIKFTDIRFTTFIKVFVDGIKFHDFLLKWRWLTPVRILKPLRLWQPKRTTEL